MKKRTAYFIILLALLVFVSIAIGGHDKEKPAGKASKEDIYKQLELFADAISIIRSEYVDETDSKKLMYGAMHGMLASLDDFSQFMEPEEYSEIKIETKGEFGGVGIEVSLKDGIITVVAPLSGTPAESAGIKPGDRIVRIDGKITRDMTLDDAVKSMRGKPGTSLVLTVWRDNEKGILDIPLKRAMIKMHSIKNAEVLEDRIGYIKIAEFQARTPGDLDEALKSIEAQGIDALILDLRNNPGGLLDVAVDVSERFIPKDRTIVSIKSRNNEQNMVFRSSGKFTHPDYPIVVLVNGGAASASEILAGAIQDNKRGLILGTKTFGKASVQTVIPLRDGSAIKLTSASYFTPLGKLIRQQGIVPDVVVEREETKEGKKEVSKEIFDTLEEKKEEAKKKEPGKETVKRDNQLDMAVNIIKAMKIVSPAAKE